MNLDENNNDIDNVDAMDNKLILETENEVVDNKLILETDNNNE